ncbi:hypothetical protein NQZ68_029078 [Dissostichus eleginoides]|nr:hypothetical protein NQZ68_029078 [Dissostichus eleginoides]
MAEHETDLISQLITESDIDSNSSIWNPDAQQRGSRIKEETKRKSKPQASLLKPQPASGLIPSTKETFDGLMRRLVMNITDNIFTPPPTHR